MSHVELEQLLVRDALDARVVALERPVLGDVRVQRRDVEPVRRVARRPRCRRRRSTRAPLLVQLGRGDPADVAEALHDAALLGEVPAEPLRTRARSTITTPAPVASCRNTEPPIEIGLPVTISGTA